MSAGTCWDCGGAVSAMQLTCPHCAAALDRPRVPAPGPVEEAPSPIQGGDRPTTDVWHCRNPGCDTPVPVGEACWCGATQPSPQEAPVRLCGDGVEIVLDGPGPWTVGRRSATTPQLAGLRTVSGEHVRVGRRADGALDVTDLNSTNRTYLDGRCLEPGVPVSLEPPAVLGLGTSYSFQVRLG